MPDRVSDNQSDSSKKSMEYAMAMTCIVSLLLSGAFFSLIHTIADSYLLYEKQFAGIGTVILAREAGVPEYFPSLISTF